jgi:predicted nucleic acid-binding protein
LSRLLCDAGVWIAAIREEDRFHEASARLIDACAGRVDSLAALDLTLYEVANVATIRGGSTELCGLAVGLVRDGAAGAIVRCNEPMLERASELALEHRISVYDAAYVATSQALGWTLVSTDIRDLVGRGFAVTPDQVAI